jgi:anti-sigma28 factor (negative regulator of flagellin synthesis)
MHNAFRNPLDIDKHRISSIRVQLNENSYVVNTRQIADKIIDIEIALYESLQAAAALAHNG